MNLFYHNSGSPEFGGSTPTFLPIVSGTLAASGFNGSGIWVFLSGNPDLSAVRENYDSIYLSNPTAWNFRRIYSIRAVDNTNKIVKLDHVPSGLNNGFWRIGGYNNDFSGILNYGLRCGDILNICTSVTGLNLPTLRSTTLGLPGSGYIRIINSGVSFPVITSRIDYNATQCVISTGINFNCVTGVGATSTFYRCIFGPSNSVFGITSSTANFHLIGCEIKNINGHGIVYKTSSCIYLYNNYIHNCAGNGLLNLSVAAITVLSNNIIVYNSGHGIAFSGAPTITAADTQILTNNTIVGNQNAGIAFGGTTWNIVPINNIFLNNGDAHIKLLVGGTKTDTFMLNNFYGYGVGTGNSSPYVAISGLTGDLPSGNPLLFSDFSTDILSAIRNSSAVFPFTEVSNSNFDIGAIESLPAVQYIINMNGGMR
jgi:hypothetical protein